MSKVTIRTDRCKGCLLCVDACPKKILEADKQKLNAQGYYSVHCTDEEKCIACAMCAVMCPDSAIKIEK